MPAKKSPQQLRGKVIGARFTPNEQAAIDILRGQRPASTWLHDIAAEAIAKAKKDNRL